VGAAARQTAEQHPGWVIIWLARISRYRARPLFRTQRETVRRLCLTAQPLTTGAGDADGRGKAGAPGPAKP
jgi:hypothetical protein